MNALQKALFVMVTAGVAPSGCAGPPLAPLISATATVKNNIDADGCSYTLTIDQLDYAPDSDSIGELDAHEVHHGEIIAIKYYLTRHTARVPCGFASHRDLPEISFVFDE